MKDFIDQSIKIQELLGLKSKKPTYRKINYSKYISSNPDSVKVLKKAIDIPGSETLVVAPTGTGKTYSIDLLFESINDVKNAIIKEFSNGNPTIGNSNPDSIIKFFLDQEKKNLNILFCPNKIQNLQNENKYEMSALVSQSKDLTSYDLNETNNFSSVYEKAKEVREYVATLDDVKINLVIDEAHLLVDESHFGFRGKALLELNQLIQEVLDKKGSILYITATPDSLKIKPFDYIIEFEDKKYTAPTNKIDIICNNSYQSMVDFCHKHISDISLPFFRLNSFNITENIIQLSDILNGKTFLTVDGKTKGYTTFRDIYGNQQKVYDNKLFGDIVENGNIPTSITIDGKEVKIDGYGATSVLEVGSNINTIGGTTNQDLTPVYVCQNQNNMSINSIIQFFNRVRFFVNRYVLLMPGKEQVPMKSLETIIKEELIIKDTYLSSYNDMIRAYKAIAIDNEDIIETVGKFLNSDTKKDGSSSDLGYLYFDNDTLEVKAFMYSFWNTCYSKYISQYFYNVEALASELSKKLKVKVNIIEDYNVSNYSTEINEQVKNFFSTFEITPEIEKQVLSNDIKDNELKKYTALSLYKEVENLISLGVPVEEAFKTVGSMTKGEITKKKTKIVKEIIIKMTNKELDTMIDYICDTIDDSVVMSETLKHNIFLIKDNAAIVKYIKGMKNLDVSNSKILKGLIKSKSAADLNRIVYQELVSIHIDNYTNGRKFMLVGGAGTEARIILDSLYKINASGNLVQTTISSDIIDTIRKQLKKELSSIYSDKDIIELIQYCFRVKKDKDTKQIKIYKLRNK